MAIFSRTPLNLVRLRASALWQIVRALPDSVRLNDGAFTWSPDGLLDALQDAAQRGEVDTSGYVVDTWGIYRLAEDGTCNTTPTYAFADALDIPEDEIRKINGVDDD